MALRSIPEATNAGGGEEPVVLASAEVARVEIVPARVLTTAPTSFALSAVARDAAGIPISTPLPVKWSGGVSFEDVTVNPGRVVAPTPGDHTAHAQVGGVMSAEAAHIIVAAEAT